MHGPAAGLLAAVPITLIVFHVLRSGRDHSAGSPYVLRRALLEDLRLQVPGAVQVPPAFPGDAAALLRVTRGQGLGGDHAQAAHLAVLPPVSAPANGSRSGTSARSMCGSGAVPVAQCQHLRSEDIKGSSCRA